MNAQFSGRRRAWRCFAQGLAQARMDRQLKGRPPGISLATLPGLLEHLAVIAELARARSGKAGLACAKAT